MPWKPATTATWPSPKRVTMIRAVDLLDARRAMGVVGADRDLPALPGAGIDAHRLQRDGQKAGRHLLAGRDDRVVFARIVEGRLAPRPWRILHPADQLVGLAGHGGDDDRDLVAGIDLAFDVAGHIADAVEVGDGRAAEFHHDAGHEDWWSRALNGTASGAACRK